MSKILIIEDEEFLADMYRTKFEADGFEVLVAGDGQEGLDMAKKEKPDLVFLDLVMPVMSGFQTLEGIRSDATIREMIVIILSNLGQQEEIDKGMALGANAFLIKAHLTPRDLADKAREVLAVKSKGVQKVAVPANNNDSTDEVKFNGRTILFIEDNKEIIQMYQLQFMQSGYAVELAENGAWGVKLAKEKKFDAIVMDIMMPAMNGYEMLKNIKADSENQQTPVIVISNSAQDEEIDKALALGAEQYFIKANITPGKLMEELVKLMARK